MLNINKHFRRVNTGTTCNSFDNAIQCMGYAYMIAEKIVGSNPRSWQKKKEQAKAMATAQNADQPAPTPPKRKTAKRTAPKSPAKSQIVTTTKDSILSKPKKEE